MSEYVKALRGLDHKKSYEPDPKPVVTKTKRRTTWKQSKKGKK